jgi:hypothetical protein
MFLANMGYVVPDVNVNFWALIAATAAAMAIGSIWFGPLFGEKWLKLVGLKKKDTQDSWQLPMVTMLVMAFVQAYVLRHFIVYASYFYSDYSELGIGLVTALWLFVGLILPLILSSNMFARRPKELTYMEAGNQLVTLLVMGAILATWN